jgi:hypothetical protein
LVNIVDIVNPAQAIHRRILRDIEREWSDELGSKHFNEFKDLLLRVWVSPLAR